MSRIHTGPIAVRALEIFDVAARLGSFTAAGAELGITQSAVSRQIADLEARLDVQLFARSGPNLSLTPKGRELAAGVGQGFQQIATSLAKIRTPTEHIVTLSMLPSVAAKWFSPRLGDFVRHHGDIDLRISVGRHLVDFRAEHIDAAIRYGRGDWPFLNATLLAKEEVFPVCTPEYAARNNLAVPQDLAGATLLHTDILDDWSAWFRAAHISVEVPSRLPRMEDDNAVLQAALSGQGAALGRSVLVADDLAAGRLVAPFEMRIPASYDYWFVYPAEKVPTPALQEVKRWVVNSFDKLAGN
ncbi:LysR substrate-binding domain-containing protein [Maritalea myrionectae]|uniref:LysR substrate-binding domain-containing protein n=1 Tax=Maritalea myrionectae TaxID=454601 RepID=UPI000414B382|nr:LysR substrate-binding domain-containing protein [Maritalea myrionectae]